MKRNRILLPLLSVALCLLIVAVGCQSDGGQPTMQAPTIEEPRFVSNEVSLVTLLRNPYTYRDELVRVSGQYKPLPIMACRADAHLSPATWVLTEGNIEMPAAGFDQVLRDIGENDRTLMVEGRWRYWKGPVGCGRRAPEDEIWYLDVSRIIDPNPLGLASLDQSGDQVIGALPEATQQATETPELFTATSTSAVGIPTITATASPTPLPPPTQSQLPTNTPLIVPTDTVTPSPPSGSSATSTRTPTPSGTATAGGPTPTATNTSTATPTPTVVVGGGVLPYELILGSEIGVGGVHVWEFEAVENEIISVSVGPTPGLDVIIELVDPDGTTIESRNAGVAGQPESINQYTIGINGEFTVEVRAVAGSSGNYAIVLTNTTSEAFLVFQPFLSYGGIGTGNLPADTDHLWSFQAAAGDVVTIQVDPASSEDLVLFLFSPDSEELIYVDENGSGDSEQITGFVITDPGTHYIRVGELEFQPASYTVILNSP